MPLNPDPKMTQFKAVSERFFALKRENPTMVPHHEMAPLDKKYCAPMGTLGASQDIPESIPKR